MQKYQGWGLGLLLSMTSWADDKFKNYEVLPPDGRIWKFAEPERVVTIGDIHGDFDALIEILYDAQLIDKNGRWAGGTTNVVFMGDLFGKGPDSFEVVEFLMGLERQAGRASGKVHVLLGNHEARVLSGNFSALPKEDLKDYARATRGHGGITSMFDRNGEYGAWLANRNAMIQIGNRMYTHAGMRGWALKFTPAEINATIRKWICYWQKACSEPPEATRWTVGLESKRLGIPLEDGPMYTRAFNLNDKKNLDSKTESSQVTESELDEIYKKYKLQESVIGHDPVVDGHEMKMSHPELKHVRLRMADTGISEAVGGHIMYSETRKRSSNVDVHRVKRGSHKHMIKRIRENLLRNGCDNVYGAAA